MKKIIAFIFLITIIITLTYSPVYAVNESLDLGCIEKSKGENWCWANAGTTLLNYFCKKYNCKFSQEDFFKLVNDKESTYQVKNSDRLECGNLASMCYGVMKGLHISSVSQKIFFYITQDRPDNLMLEPSELIKVCKINENIIPYIKLAGIKNLSHTEESTIENLLKRTIVEKNTPLIVYVFSNSDKKLNIGPNLNEYKYGYSSQNKGIGHIIIVKGVDFDKEIVVIQDPGDAVEYTMKIKKLNEIAFRFMWVEAV